MRHTIELLTKKQVALNNTLNQLNKTIVETKAKLKLINSLELEVSQVATKNLHLELTLAVEMQLNKFAMHSNLLTTISADLNKLQELVN
jgi:hypothetical protein